MGVQAGLRLWCSQTAEDRFCRKEADLYKPAHEVLVWMACEQSSFNSLHAVYIFSCFCCHILIYFKLTFQKILSGTLRVSNGLDPDQNLSSVGPDLGPNCLQRLSADSKSHRYQGKLYKPMLTNQEVLEFYEQSSKQWRLCRVCFCVGSPEPSLLNIAISSKISCARPFYKYMCNYFLCPIRPGSPIGSKSDCRSWGHEIDPSPVLYFHGDLSWNFLQSFSSCWFNCKKGCCQLPMKVCARSTG